MTSHAKEILNEAVDRQESLLVSRGFEPPHLSLALAGRLMGDFGSIVFVHRTMRPMALVDDVKEHVGSVGAVGEIATSSTTRIVGGVGRAGASPPVRKAAERSA